LSATWSPEFALVASLARLSPTDSDRDRTRTIAAGRLDWDRVLRLAAHHGVLALANAARERGDLAPIPTHTADRIREQHLSTASSNLAKYSRWIELLGRFRKAGIPVLTLKGFPVAIEVYGSIALRPVGDLDLLVDHSNVPAALELLEGRGYYGSRMWNRAIRHVGFPYLMEHASEIPVVSPSGLMVDLHWEAEVRSVVPRGADLLRSARTLVIEDTPVLVPSLSAVLLLLLAHGHRSGWARLRWLVDVAEWMDQLPGEDCERAATQLRAAGAPSILPEALARMRAVWGRVPTGATGAASVESTPRTMRHYHRVLERDWDSASRYDAWRHLRIAWDRFDHHRSAADAVADILRPGPFEWSLVSLPSWLRIGYYPIRPLRVLWESIASRARWMARRRALPAEQQSRTHAARTPDPPRPPWRTATQAPFTFVTAVYRSDPSSLLGGRGWDINTYLPSLINIGQLGVPVVVYCPTADVERIQDAIRPYFISARVEPFELSAFEFFEEVVTWKEEYVDEIKLNDRNEVLCFLKSYWLQQTINANPFGHDTFFWIDAGLSHHGIFPERVGGVELRRTHPPERYHPLHANTIFTPALADALKAEVTESQVMFCAMPFNPGYPGTERYLQLAERFSGRPAGSVRIEKHLVGGIFGGSVGAVRRLHEEYGALLAEFISSRTRTLEEQVFSTLYAIHPELFRLEEFDVWHFHSPGERTSYLPAEGESFYKIFVRLRDGYAGSPP
jgi:hypothetical protein